MNITLMLLYLILVSNPGPFFTIVVLFHYEASYLQKKV
jgi:hypothetical protein